MAGAAIAGGKLPADFADFLDIVDAEAIGVTVTLSDYRSMSDGERAAWRAWQRARRQQRRPGGAERRAAAAQASVEGRAAWERARVRSEQG